RTCQRFRSNGPCIREVLMSAFDFSTGSFNAAQHYSAVSMQQGRVQLDADSSDDSEANSEKIRRLTADTVMPDADLAPRGAVTPVTQDPTRTNEDASAALSGALTQFEPIGGLHPLATESSAALFYVQPGDK